MTDINQYEDLLKALYVLINKSKEKQLELTTLDDKVAQIKITNGLIESHRKLRLYYFEVEDLINN